MDEKLLRHDGLVHKVEQELIKRKFNHLFTHVEYNKFPHCGEIDIYAEKDNYILLFEIKGRDCLQNYNKAVKQMTRAEQYFFDKQHRIFKFYVCYDDKDNIKYNWVRNNAKL